jgi:hypothetical protein
MDVAEARPRWDWRLRCCSLVEPSKATGGWLGERLGVIGSVMVTEAATALLILATLFASLTPTLVLLPLLGIVLNGTSSVLYGTVPELSDGDTRPGRSRWTATLPLTVRCAN